MNCSSCFPKSRHCHIPSKATRHWLSQRLTAIALLPLVLWIALMFFTHPFFTYQDARTWMGTLQGAIALLTLVGILCYHSALGLQAVLEDYLSTISLRRIIIFLEKLFFFFLFMVALIALYKIHKGGR